MNTLLLHNLQMTTHLQDHLYIAGVLVLFQSKGDL